MASDFGQALAGKVISMPDLAILDDFPASKAARAAYYSMRSHDAGLFIALNDAPGHRRFLHLNALPFMTMMHRNSDPEDILMAGAELLGNCRPIQLHKVCGRPLHTVRHCTSPAVEALGRQPCQALPEDLKNTLLGIGQEQ